MKLSDRRALVDAIANQDKPVRIPVHMKEMIDKMNNIKMNLTLDLGREPTLEEISEKLGGIMNVEKVRELQELSQDYISSSEFGGSK